MTEDEARAAVVAEAYRWVGTPFRDQGAAGSKAVKGVAVDCATLAIEVFSGVGVIPWFDPRPYPPRWHLHQDEERFLGWIEKVGVETGEIKPANVIVYKEGRCFSHCGIITADGNLIHAYWRNAEVIVSPLNQSDLEFYPRTGKPRPRKIFDIWAKRA